ncbi:MAG: ParA family protein [Burkholderiaceae bacterium]
MPVIAVINRKGGSGKSTLATHIAAWCAHQGLAVMLGDADRQQSTRTWLRLRNPALPGISPWAVDQNNSLRVPASISHVVLDTPGGLQGFDLARIVMFADAIVIPVCNSVFDRDAAAACHAELTSLPRVASGRCRVAVVGMRVDARTQAAQTLKAWCDALPLPFLGALRETQGYVRNIEQGQTLFDLPAEKNAHDRQQWEPILHWLGPLVRPAAAVHPTATALQAQPTHTVTAAPCQSRATALMPQQESLVHGGRLAAANARAVLNRHAPVAPVLVGKAAAQRTRSIGDGSPIPDFLRQPWLPSNQ